MLFAHRLETRGWGGERKTREKAIKYLHPIGENITKGVIVHKQATIDHTAVPYKLDSRSFYKCI